jgi:hypothetical protein
MKTCVIALLGFLTCSALAQTSVAPPAQASDSAKQQQDAKRAEIRKLIELTGAANVSTEAMRHIIAPIRTSYPDVPDAFWDTFLKEVHPDELIDLVVPIYDRYYTLDEIHDLTRFYESPVGQKTIKVLPKLSAEAIDAGQQWGQTITDRAMRKLRQKGYDTSSLHEPSSPAAR